MDPDVTPIERKKAKVSLASLLSPLKNLGATVKKLVPSVKKLVPSVKKLVPPVRNVVPPVKSVVPPVKNVVPPVKSVAPPVKSVAPPVKNVVPPVKNVVPPVKSVAPPVKNLRIPKKLMIPAIAAVALLIAGGAAFGVLHARLKHGATQAKAVTSAPVASVAEPSASCSGVVRDIYRQTVEEDPSVTLAEVRAEVKSSGVSCVPVPAIAAELKDLSPGCRDMVQYTFLGVREGHDDIKVHDVREKVVLKSVACEHDRPANIAAIARHRAK